MSTHKKIKKNPLTDISLWFLVFSNLTTLYFAITQNWNASTILLIYWFQNVTIGFFNFIRIMQIKEVFTEKITIKRIPAQSIQKTNIHSAFFFLFHYGFFHVLYLSFLLNPFFSKVYGTMLDLVEIEFVLVSALLFFLNHLFSYIYNKSRDTKKQDIHTLMIRPYSRIIPMHLTILFGAFFASALPLFLILKTFIDARKHIQEHSASTSDSLI